MSDLHHPLTYSYTIWHKRNPLGTTVEAFEQSLVNVGSFNTAEGFWALYSYLARPSDCPPKTEYLIFKTGIKPMWEDDVNLNGGKWVIRFKKGASTRSWENLALALIGNQFGTSAGEEICGIVVSLKPHEDVISIWNKTATNRDATTRIRDVLKEALDIPVNAAFEYRPHHASLNSLQSKTQATSPKVEESIVVS